MNFLAHAGGTGWDEILLAIAPLIIAGVIFVLGQRRAQHRAEHELSPAPIESTHHP
jgi:hypothetical protein